MQKCVVEWFTTILGRLNEDTKVLHNLLLSAEVFKAQRPQGILEVLFFLPSFLSYVEIFQSYIG